MNHDSAHDDVATSRLHRLVERAERTRRDVEQLYRYTGVRGRGFDDLLRHLAELITVAEREPKLERIVFFARRALADVEVGLVSAYHGMLSVATDAMRDMMEIQLLLRHFSNEPSDLERWWQSSKKDRKRDFGPARLRKIHQGRIGVAVASLKEVQDYASHSGMLHVTPEPGPRRGVASEPDMLFEIDLVFAEILWHSVGVIHQYHDVAVVLHPDTASPPPQRAASFLDAANNAKAFTMTFIQASQEARRKTNEDAENDAS